MKLDVLKVDGSKSGETVELSEEIFGINPNDHVIYLDVKAFLANQRQGTHKAKERGEVRGGGKKPWRQKGRGTARAGTTRSPLWVGGGRIFGPRPRSYNQKVNEKVKKLARKSALSLKAQANQILVVEDFNFEEPKTRKFVELLNSLELRGKKVLLLTGENLRNVYLAGRNLPRVSVLEARNASTYHLLNNQVIVFQKSAVETLTKILN